MAEVLSFYGTAKAQSTFEEEGKIAFVVSNPKKSMVTMIPIQLKYNNFSNIPLKVSLYLYARPAGKLTRSESIFSRKIHNERIHEENGRLYSGTDIVLMQGELAGEEVVASNSSLQVEVKNRILLEAGTFCVAMVSPLAPCNGAITVSMEVEWEEVE